MFSRPHFREYVIARLITIAVIIFVICTTFLMVMVPEGQSAMMPIVLLAIAFIIFIVAINRGATRMQKELNTINTYLRNLDKIDTIAYKTRFFTQEFEEMNQNLIKVLKDAKKREDTKQQYNAKLKLKNRQRADMLSAIAHEFRNPISSIMGYAQTLQDDATIPKSLQEKFLGKIYNNGNKIEALLARLILWNKFESKETTLHQSTFDLHILIQEVIQALEDTYKERNIVLRGQSREIKADRTLMEVVLKNLIENALKYSKDDVVVTLLEEEVLVEDKGIGISEKELEKVTKKFYRSGTHNWDNSMGLGLSIVKNILSMHGSKLEIESQLDVGSRFFFKI